MKFGVLRAVLALFAASFLVSGTTGCSDSSSGDQGETGTTTIDGVVWNTAVAGAQVKAFFFDKTGDLVEIKAQNAPVKTDSTGMFRFLAANNDLLRSGESPLIIQTAGGLMGEGQAPNLAAVIQDFQGLGVPGGRTSCLLSTVSSVAAQMLRNWASTNGAPNRNKALEIVNLVEDSLGVDLSISPATPESAVALFNGWIDQNLGAGTSPPSAAAINDLIAYLAANLETGALDGRMMVNGVPVAASFHEWPGLEAILASPDDFIILSLVPDRLIILNDNKDSSRLTATLRNGLGQPLGDGLTISMGLVSGPGILTYADHTTEAGQTFASVRGDSSGDTGPVTVEASYELELSTVRAGLTIGISSSEEVVEKAEVLTNAFVAAVAMAKKGLAGLENLDKALELLMLRQVDPEGMTPLEIASLLFQILFDDPTPCGDPGLDLAAGSVSFTFNGGEGCSVNSGKVTLSPGWDGTTVYWATTFEDVTLTDCVINGWANASVGVDEVRLTYTHSSTDLDICQARMNGTSSMTYDLLSGLVEEAVIRGRYSFDLDGTGLMARVDLSYAGAGISGEASVVMGETSYECLFENVTFDSDCGIPNGGTAVINGWEVDFSQANCGAEPPTCLDEDPTVCVNLPLVGWTKVSIAKARDLITG